MWIDAIKLYMLLQVASFSCIYWTDELVSCAFWMFVAKTYNFIAKNATKYIMRVWDGAITKIQNIFTEGALIMANSNQIAFLCSRLKELREKNGCTMDDMVKKIDVLEGLEPGTGMNKSSISRVEGGKTTEKLAYKAEGESAFEIGLKATYEF